MTEGFCTKSSSHNRFISKGLLVPLKRMQVPELGTRGRLVSLIDGENVIVRPVLPTDVLSCYALYSSLSPRSRRYSGSHALIRWAMLLPLLALSSVGPARRFLLDLLPLGVASAYAAKNSSRKIIGLFFLKVRRRQVRVAELGEFIADDYQGRNLGKSLLRMEIAEGYSLGFRELVIAVHSQNRKVINIYQKMGFTLLKRLPTGRLLMHLILDSELKSKRENRYIISTATH